MAESDSEREVAIFSEALKLPREQRDAFLKRMCRGDEYLCHRLEAMLQAHDRLGNFLEEGPDVGEGTGDK